MAELERARRLNPLEPAIALAAARRDAAAAAGRGGGAPATTWCPAPLGRRPLDCRPVLGLGTGCSARPARMTRARAHARWRGPPRAGDRAVPMLAAARSLPIGFALGLALYGSPPPLAVASPAGWGLSLVLALALARYHAAVALGALLLGVQVVDPAPSDGVFVVVMAVAFATGRFRLRAVPRPVVAILAVFGALNVMASVQVVDPARAIVFFGTTAYLALFALWLAGYTTSRRRAQLLVRAYVAAAVASAVIGVLALLGVLPGAELLTESDRGRALFQDPNVFGPFLIPPALILVEEIVRPRLLSARLATKAALLAILLVGVLFSYSRGAWLNLALALVVLGLILSLRGGARTGAALRRDRGAPPRSSPAWWWRPAPSTSSPSARARRPTTPTASAASGRGCGRPRSTRSGRGRGSSSRSPTSRPTAPTRARSGSRDTRGCSRCWRSWASR